MDFLSLPVEIGAKIFNFLDTKTKINVYNSCEELRDYFTSWCHLRTVNLSRSTLASAKTLQENLFTELGGYILELNLSGVQDLTVDNLKPYVKKFVSLKFLDVTFTKIYIVDILEICPPSLTSIGINFFCETCEGNYERVHKDAKAFFEERQFEFVHFVVTELNLSAVPLNFLKEVNSIKHIKLTLSHKYKDFGDVLMENSFVGSSQIQINFNKIIVEVRDCAVTHKFSRDLNAISRLNYNQLEYMFIMYMENIEIYVSPRLAKIFTISCSDLKVEVSTYLPLDFMLDGNIIFKAWNTETTNFDEAFYNNLRIELKDYLPTYFCMHDNYCMKITDSLSTWFCIDKCRNFDKIPEVVDKITLTNYCRNCGILLQTRCPINFLQTLKPLQNLTFLTMNNIMIRHKFFTVLFQHSSRLVTLVLYIDDQSMVRSYTRSLASAIHLAKLKNFMLTSENIQYDVIFEILCGCSSLENVHICEYEREISEELIDHSNILVFIENCVDLYSLFIETDMSAEDMTTMISPLRATVQTLGRYHLSIDICLLGWCWNHFADVFNPSPLHIFN